MNKVQIGNWIEILRIVGCILGINFGYWNWIDPTLRLQVMTGALVLCLSGTVAFGLLFLGESASERIGYAPDRAFQIQSGLNNLAVVTAFALVLLFKWNIYAHLALLLVVLVFFTLSSINHTRSWLIGGNRKTANIIRPFVTLLLIAGTIPAVWINLQSL